MRQIYWSITRKVDSKRSYEDQHTTQKHSNSLFQVDGTSAVNFIWSPFLNTSIASSQLMSTAAAEASASMHPTNAILVIGGGTWHTRFLRDNALDEWKRALGNISTLMGRHHNARPVGSRALNLVAPVQIPIYDSLSVERRRTINPTTIEAMNAHLLSISSQNSIEVPWAFARMTYEQPNAYDTSGLHVTEHVADRMADVILNLKCNDILSSEWDFPMDMTCCSRYARLNEVQTSLVLLSAGVLLLHTILYCVRLCGLRHNISNVLPVSKAFSIIGVCLTYCYLADRTQLFNKSQKHYIGEDFQIMSALSLLIGLISIRPCTPATRSTSDARDPGILSRDQTDEWKGWMQIVILIYHYAGASKVLPIYECIRLLVASYLFLTGFGHTVFYLKKPDYSLKRVATILVRLNLLSILLPYFMKTNYLFYYFAPLTSFWYSIIYVTMRFQHHKNGHFAFVRNKILFSTVLVNLTIRTPLVFENLFKMLAIFCNIHWDVNEWLFRLQLDSYIVFVGMMCGLFFIQVSWAMGSNKQSDLGAFDHVARHSGIVTFGLVPFAILTLWIFQIFATGALNKYAYNAYMPYISCFPILAFVVLRNCHHNLRAFHSKAFAWIGRISLETFTLQFHIWLAADTKGLLRTGILDLWYGPEIDLVVLTVIFLWMSKIVSDATGVITSFIIDPGSNGRLHRHVHAADNVLPRVKIKEGLSEQLHIDSQTALPRSKFSRIRTWISSDLRVRLCLIMVGLWMVNMVY